MNERLVDTHSQRNQLIHKRTLKFDGTERETVPKKFTKALLKLNLPLR